MRIGNGADFANSMFKMNTGKTLKQQKKINLEKQRENSKSSKETKK